MILIQQLKPLSQFKKKELTEMEAMEGIKEKIAALLKRSFQFNTLYF